MCMRNKFLLFSIAFLLSLSLLSACVGDPASSTTATTQPTSTTQRNTGAPASPVSTITLPNEGVAATIPVGSKPDITVESGSAKQLTLLGSDTHSISSDSYALPYRKKGNAVSINFGQTIAQPIKVTIPAQSTLTVTLTAGNVIVENIQGQVTITLTNGTIQLKNFTPYATSTITVQSGTIDATFAKQTSCDLNAQTEFGAIVSGYAAIREKRSSMKAQASGIIGHGSSTIVNLTTSYGSISIGPV